MKKDILDIIEQTREPYEKWRQEHAIAAITQKQLQSDSYTDISLHARHMLTIGGTAAAAIAGFSNYATPADIFNTMTGRTEPFKGNYATRRGNALEELISARASELLCADLYRPTLTNYSHITNCCETYFHPETLNGVNIGDKDLGGDFSENLCVSFISAQIDSLLYDGSVFTICECKTAAQNPLQKDGQRLWGDGCTLNASGLILEEDDRIPISYIAQVQWQLLTLDLVRMRTDVEGYCGLHAYNTAYAYVACDIAGKTDIKIYKIYRDEQMQLEMMQAVSTFILSYLIKDQAPPTLAVATQPLAIAEEDPHIAKANKTFMDYYGNYVTLKAQVDSLTEQLNDTKEQMLAAVPACASAVVSPLTDKILLKRNSYKRTCFDSKGLANKYPEIYKEFVHKDSYQRVTFY